MKLSKSLLAALSSCPIAQAFLAAVSEGEPDIMPAQAPDAKVEDHPFARFLAECCVQGPGRRVRVSELCARVAVWWEDHYPTLSAPTPQWVGRFVDIFTSGVKIRQNHETGRFYVGLGIKPAPPLAFGQCAPNAN
jgi:hypothetical protein